MVVGNIQLGSVSEDGCHGTPLAGGSRGSGKCWVGVAGAKVVECVMVGGKLTRLAQSFRGKQQARRGP